MTEKPTRVGISFIARFFGVHRKTVYRVLNLSPELQALGPRHFTWPAAEAAFMSHLRNLTRADVGHSDNPSQKFACPHVSNFFKERAMREKWCAEMARLNYLVRAGKLIEVETVAREMEELAINLRNALLLIPDRCAPILIGLSVEKIRQIIEEEIIQALENFGIIINDKKAEKSRAALPGDSDRGSVT